MLKKVKDYKKDLKRNKRSGKSKDKLTIDRVEEQRGSKTQRSRGRHAQKSKRGG